MLHTEELHAVRNCWDGLIATHKESGRPPVLMGAAHPGTNAGKGCIMQGNQKSGLKPGQKCIGCEAPELLVLCHECHKQQEGMKWQAYCMQELLENAGIED